MSVKRLCYAGYIMDDIQPAQITSDAAKTTLFCKGSWSTADLQSLSRAAPTFTTKHKQVNIDGSAITQFDSAGAYVLQKIITQFKAQHVSVNLVNFNRSHADLLELIGHETEKLTTPPVAPKFGILYDVGKQTIGKFTQLTEFLAFIGELCVVFFRTSFDLKRFPWKAFFSNLDSAGTRALPILALLSFLIGVVLTYQIGLQLQIYGANIYVVNFLGLALLREFGPLMTAIIVAGRTSSAFTAQIGTMKVNEEIDAIRTFGLSPFKRLVLPKILALIIAMPLLTFWSDLFSVLGGMVMSKNMLDINYYDFITRFGNVVSLKNYTIGLSKAPVFAVIIATVGCFQGLQVDGSAESVGWQTTKSVVQAIFLIIIADSIYSIFFSWQDF